MESRSATKKIYNVKVDLLAGLALDGCELSEIVRARHEFPDKAGPLQELFFVKPGSGIYGL